MRADHNRDMAGGEPFQQRAPHPSSQPSGQPGNLDTQFAQPAPKIMVMLFGQQLGGRHQRGLGTDGHGPQSRHGGYHGFTGANIALQQTQHRMGLAEVGGDLFPGALLGAGQGKRQLFQESLTELAVSGQRWRGLSLRSLAQASQAQLVSQQFLECQPAPGGMTAVV